MYLIRMLAPPLTYASRRKAVYNNSAGDVGQVQIEPVLM